MSDYYIASCVFTSKFPELSRKIRECVRERYGLEIVRCCVPKYKIQDFESRMPEGTLRDSWSSLPDSGMFVPGDKVYSLCHNCNNIIEEMHPGVEVYSLWELISSNPTIPLPDLTGTTAYVQDCWRSRDRAGEQDAVRNLMSGMNINIIETSDCRTATNFCGASLYRPQPPRNPRLAPRHYVDGAAGKFISHTEEEQKKIMREYCSRFVDSKVICYCHYCLEGLLMGGADAVHIAELIFG